MNFLFEPGTWPFSAALLLMCALACLEGLAMLTGGGLSHWLDGDSIGLDGAGAPFLGWLHVGRVPLLMLLVLFLAAFGAMGLLLQWLLRETFGFLLPSLLASLVALLAALPCVRLGGAVLYRILPRDESSAVSLDALVGRVGVLVGGSARSAQAAEARVRDEHGRTHYVMVLPEAEETLDKGTEVLLLRREGARYRVMRNPHAGLIRP